jgi:hypothetical protein
MTTEPDTIIQAAEALVSRKAVIGGKKILVGFDGFVDEIIHPVASRLNHREFRRVEAIAEFAGRITSAAGKSANIELVPVVEKAGGNGPLMAMAAAGMGARVTCIGMLGYPGLHPVFEPLQGICERVISVGAPGHTDALEFNDGKLMLGKLHTIKDMNWERLMEVVGEEALRRLLVESDMVACTNWTMLTEMGEVLDNIIRLVPEGSRVKYFFDLADPEKRPRADLEKVLGQISALARKTDVILGLNQREAEQVSETLCLGEKPEASPRGNEAAARRIRQRLGLHGVVVHAARHVGAAVGVQSASIEGPYCRSPKLSTGAGDHFNGGFCAGIMAGLTVAQALYCGVGVSGWYVRNAKSPKLKDVVGLLKHWGEGSLND